ncbi:hypothetical protein JYU34_003828 [Plutella xylostella]|uniref:Uncharacterized protein n=1 Tax=Plutella xylostella TaxID=51655 RepID=A0ABQ7R125_PLUXY|nr:hypothetical protein JYU34_003828 [Plutella xylostella]
MPGSFSEFSAKCLESCQQLERPAGPGGRMQQAFHGITLMGLRVSAGSNTSSRCPSQSGRMQVTLE